MQLNLQKFMSFTWDFQAQGLRFIYMSDLLLSKSAYIKHVFFGSKGIRQLDIIITQSYSFCGSKLLVEKFGQS